MAPKQTRKRPALERVIETADRLFYKGGLHATGVDLIAAEANVSKATMYTYFPTKDHLVTEYLRRRSEQWRAHVATELDRRAAKGRDRILVVFDLMSEAFATPDYHGCPFINAEAECAPDSRAHQVVVAHRAWLRDVFTEALADAGFANPGQVAVQLKQLHDGAMCGRQAEPEIDWVGAAKRTVTAILDAAQP